VSVVFFDTIRFIQWIFKLRWVHRHFLKSLNKFDVHCMCMFGISVCSWRSIFYSSFYFLLLVLSSVLYLLPVLSPFSPTQGRPKLHILQLSASLLVLLLHLRPRMMVRCRIRGVFFVCDADVTTLAPCFQGFLWFSRVNWTFFSPQEFRIYSTSRTTCWRWTGWEVRGGLAGGLASGPGIEVGGFGMLGTRSMVTVLLLLENPLLKPAF